MVSIQFHHVSFVRERSDLREKKIIDDLSLIVPSQSIFFLKGPTGSGKSTFLFLVAGILRPTSGEISIDGQVISRWTTGFRDKWRRNCGILFQKNLFFEDLTAFENIIIPLIPRGGTVSALEHKVRTIAERLDMENILAQKISLLSGGERQRASLVRALIGNPLLLLLDEPSAHQDDGFIITLSEMLSQLRKTGTTILITSHDNRLQDSLDFDSAHIIENGRIREM